MSTPNCAEGIIITTYGISWIVINSRMVFYILTVSSLLWIEDNVRDIVLNKNICIKRIYFGKNLLTFNIVYFL